MTEHELPGAAIAETPTTRQRLFVRYFIAVLTDLVVLNLFAEYWAHVQVDGFTVSLLAALLLQVLLRVTLAIEHRVAQYFNAMSGLGPRVLRFLSAWAILFGSKLLMLWLIDLVFGEAVLFSGPHHVLVFIVVVVAMLAAEEGVFRIYRSLGERERSSSPGQ